MSSIYDPAVSAPAARRDAAGPIRAELAARRAFRDRQGKLPLQRVQAEDFDVGLRRV